jgi:hypothetical protein
MSTRNYSLGFIRARIVGFELLGKLRFSCCRKLEFSKINFNNKKHQLPRNEPFVTVGRDLLPYIFDMVTFSFVCHQKETT